MTTYFEYYANQARTGTEASHELIEYPSYIVTEHELSEAWEKIAKNTVPNWWME